MIEVAEAEYDEDRTMRTIVDQVQAPYKKELSQVLGTTSTPLLRYYVMETPMDNLITDALFEATSEELAKTGGPSTWGCPTASGSARRWCRRTA